MNENHQTLLEHYLQMPDQLEAALAGLSEADFDLTKGEGWSIRQVAHHIANGQMMFSLCVKAILGFEDVELPFGWYMGLTQDAWADIWAFDRRPLNPALAGLRGSILDLADLMAHLPDEAWNRSGHVTFRGQNQPTAISIEWVIGMIPAHANAHVQDDILAIRKLHGK
ncbi:MAG: hypothetical protein CVU44_14025 [Chloroflexi bacterium HGW-Chloroflexi-6]|nr:MAG: hypothetical protein CVU44_14025 [Chloroflexi bacterium HGW-Chloroflexi-6]